jgi:hypothetical protein
MVFTCRIEVITEVQGRKEFGKKSIAADKELY